MTQDEVRRTRAGRASRRVALVCAAAATALLITSCGTADDPKDAAASSAPASAPASASSPQASSAPIRPGEVRIAGEVDKPYTITLADLRGLPQAEVSVEFISAKGDQKHTYQGVLLHEVLKAAQPRFDQSKKNGQLRGVVSATGGGDYRAVFAWAELDPGFAKSQILLAVSEDGTAFEDSAGPRLVVPQDTRGGRYVSELDQLWVGTVDPVVDGAR
ncbi:molybdopterin-dependent oxidoreductase [Streptomyces xanthophaeus]|uniref:molybdopterin-dependent oxidoreductase n=1 Tax=Streptomyces xanthophaeus TaxID=67385 RepID=UPI00264A36A9|nr:molybdopterin-dependent oxidoreductase [Streptomyces xanthophaeus]WKD30955.1 molybdopterin-dependent oxidoreductase [Streptomyces xanthophaeus]